MTMAPEAASVLAVVDDAVLGDLIARNLGLRGVAAVPLTLAQALDPDWSAVTPLRLLIVSLVVPERVALADVQRLLHLPWAAGVPLLFAIDRRSALAQRLATLAGAPLVTPTDIGAIVAAARAALGQPAPA